MCSSRTAAQFVPIKMFRCLPGCCRELTAMWRRSDVQLKFIDYLPGTDEQAVAVAQHQLEVVDHRVVALEAQHLVGTCNTYKWNALIRYNHTMFVFCCCCLFPGHLLCAHRPSHFSLSILLSVRARAKANTTSTKKKPYNNFGASPQFIWRSSAFRSRTL